ncbi:MAG: VWA domain-containing protein [Spirochaetia bacterium]|jgi:Mg-chelatase subunit ChlD
MKTHVKSAGFRAGILFAALVVALFAGGAASLAAENIDLVVMVDTSESMFPYFDDLMNYLVQDLLTEKLHRGDTFHLLSFSSVPEVEISLEVNSEQAAQQAFGRILLLHALGRYTDLVSALQFLYKYVKELPETNPKQILLITDGVHDPPPGSPFHADAQVVQSAIADVSRAMQKEGWTFNILRVPPEPLPEEAGQKSYLSDIAQLLGVQIVPYKGSDREHLTGRTTGFPNLTFPGALGKVGTRFIAGFRIKNWKSEPIIVRLSSIQSDGIELLDKKVSLTIPASAEATLDAPIRLPLSFPKGDHQARVQLVFEDDLRISPTSGVLSFTYTGKGGIPIPRLTFLYVLYIVLGLGVLYLLIRLFLYLRKKMGEAPLSGMARAQASPAAAQPAVGARSRKRVPLLESPTSVSTIPMKRITPTVTSIKRALPRQRMQQASLPPLIEMRVSLQNHCIGFRNVHRIPAGSGRMVGGRFSPYLIFLVPFPAAIGEIRNQDGTYVFTPQRTELFPSLSGPVEDCLGREIPFVSPKGMELALHFRVWVSPLEEINAILRQARSSDG